MDWFLNELSLHAQFPDPQAFRFAFEPILRARAKQPELASRLFATSLLSIQPVTPNQTLAQAVQSLRDKVFTNLVLQWLTKAGPFWDVSPTPHPENYFEYDKRDVTNFALGEAARRLLDNSPAASLSFPSESFQLSPLLVQHGLPEMRLGEIAIQNCWTIDQWLDACRRPLTSWEALYTQATLDFPQLVFAAEIPAILQPSPFHFGVASRILELLHILAALVNSTGPEGALTKDGLELLQNHFVGGKASFTDESDGNKLDFKHEMTFADPENPATSIFCPWHGKVKIGQFRIHFEWPRPEGQKRIKVLYIGPKITKR